jgi:hypothetical protein
LQFKPTAVNAHAIPDIKLSIAPEARNTPIPTKIATKNGIIFTAIEKPSLAPSIKESYTFIFFRIANKINPIMMVNKIMFAATEDTTLSFQNLTP